MEKTIIEETKTLKTEKNSKGEVTTAYIQPRIKMTGKDYELLVNLVKLEEKRTGIKIVIVPASTTLVDEPK